jgi:response regulator RpfG family c-di-GMP phosphodiesterase
VTEDISASENIAPDKARRETLLVVDDDVRVVELLQITLGGRGYDVQTAFDGETALEQLLAHPPDLVVLDVRLPKRGGLDVLQEVRKDPRISDLPVILISANAATEARLQGLRFGADDYVTKPFSPRELILRVRRILDRSRDCTLLRLRNQVLEAEVRKSRDTLLQMQNEMAESLNRVGNLVTKVLELHEPTTLDELVERFVVAAVGRLEFRRLALLLAADRGCELEVSRGVPESARRGLRFARDSALLHLVRTLGRPIPLRELESFPDVHEEVGRLAAAGLSLIVPATSDGEFRGMLALGDRSGSRPLLRHESKVLEILGHSIATAIRNSQSFTESQETFFETTSHLIRQLESRYSYMRGHSDRVCRIALEMGRRLGQTQTELTTLRWAALFHDLGEVDRYGELMQPAHELSDQARRHLRLESAERSEQMLGERGHSRVRDILRHSSERWDGTGIPDRLRGLEIPIGSRIVALADAWDALVHDRPHRQAYSESDAILVIQSNSGKQFDPDLIPVLLEAVHSLSPSLASV